MNNDAKRHRPESNVKGVDRKLFNAYSTQQYLASAISGPLTQVAFITGMPQQENLHPLTREKLGSNEQTIIDGD